jgi:hypothetical protein
MDFNDDGIFDPRQPQQPATPFDMRRVDARPLRRKLWTYLFNRLKQECLPRGCTLFIEFDSLCAWRFVGSGPDAPTVFERDYTTSHGHGESDPSMAFWLVSQCFQPQQARLAVINSRDGDLLPILLHAVEVFERTAQPDEPRQPVYWRSRGGGKTKVIEVRGYLKQVHRQLDLSEYQYMIFCILCGTDYLDKSLLCHWFGVQKIYEALYQVKDSFECWDTEKPPVTQEERQKEKEALMMFIRQLYHNHVHKPVQVLPCRNNRHIDWAQKRRPASYERLLELYSEPKLAQSRQRLPALSSIQTAYEQLSFNFRYWRDRSRWPTHLKHYSLAQAGKQYEAQPELTAAEEQVDVKQEPLSDSEAAASSSHTVPTPVSNTDLAMDMSSEYTASSPVTLKRSYKEQAEAAGATEDILQVLEQTKLKKPRASAADIIAAAASGSSLELLSTPTSPSAAESSDPQVADLCAQLEADVDAILGRSPQETATTEDHAFLQRPAKAGTTRSGRKRVQ